MGYFPEDPSARGSYADAMGYWQAFLTELDEKKMAEWYDHGNGD